MNKVGLKQGNKEGTLQWSNSMKTIEVDFPDITVKEQVLEYISTPQVFRIPQSQEVDDYVETSARPDEHDGYMRLGLCSLYAKMGIFVRWEAK